MVIAGPVALDPGRHAPERLLVEGLGPFEPDVPVAWFAVLPTGEPSPIGADLAREGLARRVGIWVSGHDARDRLAALGAASVRVVPHPALALPRLAAAADMPQVVERLRAAAVLPPGDYVALDEGAPDDAGRRPVARGRCGAAMDGARAGRRDRRGRRVRRLVADRVRDRRGLRSPGCVARRAGGCAVVRGLARRQSRPRRRDRAGAHASATPDRRSRALRAEFDAACDALVEALAPADDDRAARALRARLREEERAAHDREQDLLTYNERLNTEIVAKGPRFTALWRKIHEADRHYHWHKLRADRADEEIEKLWRLHEDRLSIRMKRKVRSTKVGDAAARALGAGPVVPPPDAELGPEGPDAPSA